MLPPKAPKRAPAGRRGKRGLALETVCEEEPCTSPAPTAEQPPGKPLRLNPSLYLSLRHS